MTYSWQGMLLWSMLLLAQNAAFTLVSRARNSSSIGYHAMASVGSNGIWFISQFILFGTMFEIMKAGAWGDAVVVGLVYTAATMTGSLGMHWIALHKIEKKVKA